MVLSGFRTHFRKWSTSKPRSVADNATERVDVLVQKKPQDNKTWPIHPECPSISLSPKPMLLLTYQSIRWYLYLQTPLYAWRIQKQKHLGLKFGKYAQVCSWLTISKFHKTTLSSLFCRLRLHIEWLCDQGRIARRSKLFRTTTKPKSQCHQSLNATRQIILSFFN